MTDDTRKPAATRFFGDQGILLLKTVEGLSLTPYDDQVGLGKTITRWVPGATIGYGHLIAQGQWSAYRDGFAQADADALFLHDAAPMVAAVQNTITVPVTQYEFDAMVILTFNIGPDGFATSSVAKLVNNPEATSSYPSVHDAWMAWSRSQGKEMKGLVNRRTCEWNIFTESVYARW